MEFQIPIVLNAIARKRNSTTALHKALAIVEDWGGRGFGESFLSCHCITHNVVMTIEKSREQFQDEIYMCVFMSLW